MSSSSPTSSPAGCRSRTNPSRDPGPVPTSFPRSRPMAQHCPECGFANDDGASYCQRCGAFLASSEPPPGVSTATYKIGETGEIEAVELEDVVARGAALVIRAGGGRAG